MKAYIGTVHTQTYIQVYWMNAIHGTQVYSIWVEYAELHELCVVY